MSKRSPRDRMPGDLPPLDDAVEPVKRKGGRPRSQREVANRQTVYLDQARYDALLAISQDHGRSIHSIILEGIDNMIGRPRKRWGEGAMVST